MTTNWHVATAAEAITAAQFARFGYDVSVQYGANQPEYDLMISSPDGRMLKISVKGSADGGWGLTQGMIHEADYHGAADKWLARHKPGLSASSSAKGDHGLAGLSGFAEVGFLVFPEIVHIEVTVSFEPVLVGLDG